MKTEVWSIREFMAGSPPCVEKRKRMERRDRSHIAATLGAITIAGVLALDVSHASAAQVAITAMADPSGHAISQTFDRKVWPMILDIGTPLAKVSMATGSYKVMRNDVSGGWQIVYRSGIGLLLLYAVNMIVRILDGIGQGLEGA